MSSLCVQTLYLFSDTSSLLLLKEEHETLFSTTPLTTKSFLSLSPVGTLTHALSLVYPLVLLEAGLRRCNACISSLVLFKSGILKRS